MDHGAPTSARSGRGAGTGNGVAGSTAAPSPTSLREIALLFLELRATPFGGPAAHIAMMEDEVVSRRRWLTRAEFLDLLGATNLIPGPDSTELAIHVGHARAGWPGLVAERGWLTEAQLLGAVAIGQVTPGPVFTTATFIGYLLGGGAGAAVATVGIFLPAFAFVAIGGPRIPRLRRSRMAGAVLDGVNATSLARMAVVTVKLGAAALVDGITVALALARAALLVRWRANSAWLVGGRRDHRTRDDRMARRAVTVPLTTHSKAPGVGASRTDARHLGSSPSGAGPAAGRTSGRPCIVVP